MPNPKYLHAQNNCIYEIQLLNTAGCSMGLDTINVSHNELRLLPQCALPVNKVDVSYNKLTVLPHYYGDQL